MRNLKRALSLLLSSTMVLGMLVMGSSAAGYQDVDASNKNQEAIEVLQAVGIMSGIDDAGNFAPDQAVTRNQMAVIMAHLLNLDYDYYRGTNTFSDVPEWAAPYVAACVAEGVTAGIGNNMYGGENKITAAQGSLMIMKALGYFQNQEDFGTDWQVATIRQASYINLFDRVDSDADSALTRGQVAQLVLNGLKAKKVTFTGDKGIQIGDVTVGYRAEYTPLANAAEKYNTIDDGTTNINADDQYYVQLGEELYNGDLKLQNSFDEFNRPARYWEYDGDEIGTYVKNEMIRKEYTEKVTGKDLYDLLGSSTVSTYDFYVSIDGVDNAGTNSAIFNETAINRNNKDTVGATGNGVLTQVFVDSNNKRVDISIINTYLAKARADYSEKNDEVSFYVYAIDNVGTTAAPVYVKDKTSSEDRETMDVAGEDFAITNIKEGDFYLVNVAKGEIQTMAQAETLDNVSLSGFSKGNYVVTDGTQYDYANTAEYNYEVLDNYTSIAADVNLKEKNYNLILDAYGYMIGVDLVDAVKNYVFITGVDTDGSNLVNTTAKMNALFLDGTSKVIDVNMDKSKNAAGDKFLTGVALTDYPVLNTWCTYTVSNDGVYTLAQVASGINTANKVKVAQQASEDLSGGTTATYDIDLKHTSLPGAGTDGYNKVYGNDSTVYLTAELSLLNSTNAGDAIVISGVESMTTGLKNANLTSYDVADVQSQKTAWYGVTPASSGVYTLYNSNGYIIASVVVGEDNAAKKNLVYVSSSDVELETYAGDNDQWTWSRKVIFNGEEIEIKEVGDSLTYLSPDALHGNMQQYQWYQVKFNANDEVIGVEPASSVMVNSLNNGAADAGEFATEIEDVEISINTYDTVLYSETFGTPNPFVANATAPVFEGSTLYVSYASKQGFFVDENVKTVLIQTNDNKKTTTYAEGTAELEDLLEDLNATATGYCYQINSILEDGRAKYVVIYDYVTTGNSGTNPGIYDYTPTATRVGNTNVLNVKANTNNAKGTEVQMAATQWLYDNGYTLVSMDTTGSNVTLMAMKNGVLQYFTTTLTSVSKITVNGVAGWYEENSIIANAGTYALYSTAQTLPVSDSTGPAGATTSSTGNVTVAYTTHNNTFLYTDLYKVNVNGTDQWYQNGMKVNNIVGGWYSTDGGTTLVKLPTGGVTVTSTMTTLKIGHKVSVDNGSGVVTTELVQDGGNTTSVSSAGLTGWVRNTLDGNYLNTSSNELQNVTSDVTVKATVDDGYNKITGVADVTTGTNFGNLTEGLFTYAVTSANAKKVNNDWFVKSSDTITITFNWVGNTIGGTSDQFAVACTAASASVTTSPVTFSAGAFTSGAPGNTQTLTITGCTGDGVITITPSHNA